MTNAYETILRKKNKAICVNLNASMDTVRQELLLALIHLEADAPKDAYINVVSATSILSLLLGTSVPKSLPQPDSANLGRVDKIKDGIAHVTLTSLSAKKEKVSHRGTYSAEKMENAGVKLYQRFILRVWDVDLGPGESNVIMKIEPIPLHDIDEETLENLLAEIGNGEV